MRKLPVLSRKISDHQTKQNHLALFETKNVHGDFNIPHFPKIQKEETEISPLFDDRSIHEKM